MSAVSACIVRVGCASCTIPDGVCASRPLLPRSHTLMRPSLRRLLSACALLPLATSALAQAPTGLAPSGQTSVALDFTFDWAPVAGATDYRVQLATGRTFHTDSLVALPGGGSVTGDSLVVRTHELRLAQHQRYFWRVRAAGKPWSDTAAFRTVIGAVVPGADYPSAGLEVIGTTPEFAWNLGTGGTGYLVQIQVREASAPKDWSQTVVSESGMDLRSFRPAAGVLRDSASYVWRVRAFGSSPFHPWGPLDPHYVWGDVSFAGKLTIGASLEVPFTTRPDLVAPLANWPSGRDTPPQPSFSWFAEMPGGAMTYDLEIVNTTAREALTGTPTVTGLTARAYTPPVPLVEGASYSWRVRACLGANRCTAWSSSRKFTVQPPAPPVTPAVSFPLGGATVYTNPVALSWYASGAASGQRYIVYTRTCTATNCSDAPAITAANTGYTASGPAAGTSRSLTVAAGTGVAWYVRTADAAGTPGLASRLAKFRTYAPPAPVAVPSWPTGNPTVYTQRPTLSWWVDGTHAGSFDVRWGGSNDPNAATLSSATATGTSFTPAADLAWGTRVYWHVRPTGQTRWRSASFTVVGAPGTLRPVAAAPSDSAVVYTPTADLVWYVDGHRDAVARYEVQVSRRSSFAAASTTTTTVDAPNTTLTTSTLTPGTTYFWRVRAFNGTGWSAYSKTARFSTAAAASTVVPLAASPAEYGEAGETPTLAWALPVGSTADLAFDVEVATDEAMTAPERLTVDATDTGSVLAARRAPGTYFWRVRSRTADGAVSEFSETAAFIVYGAGSVTAADAEAGVTALRLDPPTPMPVRRAATVRFALPTAGEATLDVLDVTGRRVRVLATGAFAAGGQTVDIDGALAPGVYVLRLTSAGTVRTQPLVVAR